MSAIYNRLAQQQAALQAVPVYGAKVDLDQPPAGDDPEEGIYLDPAIGMLTEDMRTVVAATWTAIVIADPMSILETALDAQDAMMLALDSATCPIQSLSRAPIAERSAAAQVMSVSVLVTFTVDEAQ